MKKILATIIVGITLLLQVGPAFAVTTVLPSLEGEYSDWDLDKCNEQLSELDDDVTDFGFSDAEEFFRAYPEIREPILSCSIITGRIKFWMVPFFISRILNFIIGLGGLVSVLMILVGAYFYIAGGLTDDKEKGKTVIKYALGGFILTTLSWFAVNVILLAVTG